MNHHGTKEETVTTTKTLRSHKATNGIEILISDENEIMGWALAENNGERAPAESEATDTMLRYDVWLVERGVFRWVFEIPCLPHNAVTVTAEPPTGATWPETKLSISADRITIDQAENVSKCIAAIAEYVEIAR